MRRLGARGRGHPRFIEKQFEGAAALRSLASTLHEFKAASQKRAAIHQAGEFGLSSWDKAF